MAANIDEMVKVLVVYSTEEADEIEVRFRMQKIMCARKKIGSGKHGNFLLAMNNFGEEIYVNPEDEEAARVVIEQWRNDKKEEREKATEDPQTEMAGKGSKMLLPRIVAGIALVIIVALYITHLR
ncbi:hypothetical protein [uncultured Eubacterium sp.]|uniref:hypothetical protein n=1 Tax=uncultured Eubacterium sp. TaxID=165185 RepID=UPI0025F6BE29|nr:hypothetical protein [uncultured Eubacterium sp.]